MRVVLDDEACDVTAGSVNDAVTAGAALAEDRGRVIVDVIVNGRRWSSEELASPDAGAAVAAEDEVRLVSADPAALVEFTFSQAGEALLDAGTLHRQAAEQLQAGKQQEAFEHLGQAIDIWLSVQEALTAGTRLVGIDLEHTVVNDQPADQIVQRLDDQLRSLRSALECRDVISLADTLLYEFPAVVDEWHAMVEHLQSQLPAHELRTNHDDRNP